MNITKLNNGVVFNNYKDMCEQLELEIKNSTNSKNAQFKELARYCDFEKTGHKIIIKEVYSEPIVKVENRGGSNNKITTPLSISNPRLASQWLASKNGKELYDDITRKTTNEYWWKCDVCKNEIYMSPLKRFNKQLPATDEAITCPCCWMSKDAKAIYQTLINSNIKVKLEYTFKDLLGSKGSHLRFDFAILNPDEVLLGLIEYDGGFHDKEGLLKVHDEMKNSYCNQNNIKLLRIHHTESSNLYIILDNFMKSIGFYLNKDWINSQISSQIEEVDKKVRYHQIKLHEFQTHLENLKNYPFN